MWAVLLCSKIEGCGAKAEFENLSFKLKSQEAKLKDFCYKTDRKVDKFRVQVNGFDKSVSQKAVWAEKKAEKYDRLSKHSLDESIQKKYEQKAAEWKEKASEFKNIVQEEIKISEKSNYNSYSVNRSLVNSKIYHDKFEKLTAHKSVNESLYKEAKAILEEKDGYIDEAMSIINSRTGTQIVTSLENSTSLKFKVGLTKEQYETVKDSGAEFVIIHNHPEITRPSGTDILSLWSENKATASVIVGHDGTVYIISDINRKIPLDKIYEEAYNNYKKLGYDDTFSKKKATDDFYALNAFTLERR